MYARSGMRAGKFLKNIFCSLIIFIPICKSISNTMVLSAYLKKKTIKKYFLSKKLQFFSYGSSDNLFTFLMFQNNFCLGMNTFRVYSIFRKYISGFCGFKIGTEMKTGFKLLVGEIFKKNRPIKVLQNDVIYSLHEIFACMHLKIKKNSHKGIILNAILEF